jgi:hypothetical protein
MKSFLLLAALCASTLAVADVAPPEPVAPAPAPVAAPVADPSHPQGIENVMPMGVIDGGWGYVYACYGLAIGGTLLYAVSLFVRRPLGPPPGDLP